MHACRSERPRGSHAGARTIAGADAEDDPDASGKMLIVQPGNDVTLRLTARGRSTCERRE